VTAPKAEKSHHGIAPDTKYLLRSCWSKCWWISPRSTTECTTRSQKRNAPGGSKRVATPRLWGGSC